MAFAHAAEAGDGDAEGWGLGAGHGRGTGNGLEKVMMVREDCGGRVRRRGRGVRVLRLREIVHCSNLTRNGLCDFRPSSSYTSLVWRV